jgi:N-acetylmuramoyl-L-alanine amidase
MKFSNKIHEHLNNSKVVSKRINQITLLLFCLGFLNGSYAQKDVTQKKNPIIIIDPGHGGKDTGAVTKSGTKEKDIVMGIASKIAVLNEKLFEKPLILFLTRYTDTLISLRDRTQLAKKLNADIFISIHCNQAINRTASGTEVFVHPKSEVQASASAYLGFTIQKGLTDVLGINNRGIKYGDFKVLRDNFDSNSSILLELGFLSQTDEANYLSKEESQYAIAINILQSIIKFLEL